MKRLACSGLLLLAAIGCGGKEAGTQTAQTDGAAPANTTATATTSTTTPGSTAPASVVENGASTEAGEVVALFLDGLRRGDEKAANGVLTTLAQESVAKTDFAIDPVGTKDGRYTIGRVVFVDEAKSMGLVECVWSEPSPDPTQPALEMEIVCEVRKEPQGWRISGMMLKAKDKEETFVLDFEDPKSLQAALGGGEPQSNGAVVQGSGAAGAVPAGATLTSDLGQPGTVAVPNQFPAPPNGQQPTGVQPNQFAPPPAQGQAPTQIAFPPTPNFNR